MAESAESTVARDFYQAGRLQDAIDAALADVKQNPSDPDRRGFLTELLCFAGEWERADKQIDTIGLQDPQALVGLSLIRQLIRAELSRKECFNDGRPPELLAEPNDGIQKSLAALVEIRAGNAAGAAKLLAEADELRPTVSGTVAGQPFEGFRDLDDVTAGVFEVLTSTGKYYWVPVERVLSVEFHLPKRPRDLLWRAAEMMVQDGPEGVVYIPSVYLQHGEPYDDQLRLGRGTDFTSDGGPTRGRGQRMFLVGDEATSILQLGDVEFTRE